MKTYQAVTFFLLSRKVEGCSQKTLRAYEQRLRYFFEFTGKPPEDIHKSDIELWLLSLKEKELSPFTIKSYFRDLKIFFTWCVSEERIEQSPFKNLKNPRSPRYAKKFLTEEDYQRILRLLSTKSFHNVRNTAWFTLLWNTGARLSELANLQCADLDWNQGRIKVIGKGNKERYIPFNRDCQRAVYKYLSVLGEDHKELWISDQRKPMAKDSLDSVTRRITEALGIKVKDRNHAFRRTWAYRMLKKGVPIRHVCLIGGWSSVSVLEQYVRAMESDDALNHFNWD